MKSFFSGCLKNIIVAVLATTAIFWFMFKKGDVTGIQREEIKPFVERLKSPVSTERITAIDSLGAYSKKKASLVDDEIMTFLTRISSEDMEEDVRLHATNGVIDIWNSHRAFNPISSKYVVKASFTLLKSTNPGNHQIGIENLIKAMNDDTFEKSWSCDESDDELKTLAKNELANLIVTETDPTVKSLAVRTLTDIKSK